MNRAELIEGTKLLPKLRAELPRCESETKPKWYRPKGGKCPYAATHLLPDGRRLCRLHFHSLLRALPEEMK